MNKNVRACHASGRSCRNVLASVVVNVLLVIVVYGTLVQDLPLVVHPNILPHTQILNKRSKPTIVGDIAFTRAQVDLIARMPRRKRNFVAVKTFMWELPIHYTIDRSFTSWEKRQIRRALDFWESVTCISFVDRNQVTSQHSTISVLHFTKNEGCWSFIGYKRRNQELSLTTDCFEFGIILHEVGHALGFWHEQSRPDRDDYVTVHQENVDTQENLRNFDKALWGDVTTLTIPYDLGSVMHYGAYTFNKTRLATITTNDFRMQHVIGQRETLSFHDIKQANFAYCQSRCNQSDLVCENDGYPDPLRGCDVCRCDEAFRGRTCALPTHHIGRQCGGILLAKSSPSTIQSPGYMRSYGPRQICAWLIESEEGSNIFIGIHKSPFALQCGRRGRCGDYVEIRYHSNLALPGPRYCSCLPPGPIIKSSSNRLLVFFKTQYGGQVGFRATFYSESCGGCVSQHTPNQAACTRDTQTVCVRRWKRARRRRCHGWWMWRPVFCGYTYEEASRADRCVTHEQYCCDGFTLAGGRCKKTMPSNVVHSSTTAPTTPAMWSPWSQCSEPCGACGTQTRRRKCSGKRCKDPVSVETRVCNKAACKRDMVHQCTQTVRYTVICHPWHHVRRYCIRYKKVNSVCRRKCCHGYQLSGETCAKAA